MKKQKIIKEQYIKARDLITEKIPLSTYISDNKLDYKTKNNFICCPIHIENTPSLSYSDDLKTYHCFGCGAKGTVIELHAEMKRIETGVESYTKLKALFDLASKYKVDLPNLFEYEIEDNKPKLSRKSNRKKGTERTEEFYMDKLYKNPTIFNSLSKEERKNYSIRIDNILLGISDEKAKELYYEIRNKVNSTKESEVLAFYNQLKEQNKLKKI